VVQADILVTLSIAENNLILSITVVYREKSMHLYMCSCISTDFFFSISSPFKGNQNEDLGYIMFTLIE